MIQNCRPSSTTVLGHELFMSKLTGSFSLKVERGSGTSVLVQWKSIEKSNRKTNKKANKKLWFESGTWFRDSSPGPISSPTLLSARPHFCFHIIFLSLLSAGYVEQLINIQHSGTAVQWNVQWKVQWKHSTFRDSSPGPISSPTLPSARPRDRKRCRAAANNTKVILKIFTDCSHTIKRYNWQHTLCLVCFSCHPILWSGWDQVPTLFRPRLPPSKKTERPPGFISKYFREEMFKEKEKIEKRSPR